MLRCSRCGKFVDWEDARLQVVCECRSRLELPPVLVRESTDDDRAAVMDLFRRDFGRTKIIPRPAVTTLGETPAPEAAL